MYGCQFYVEELKTSGSRFGKKVAKLDKNYIVYGNI